MPKQANICGTLARIHMPAPWWKPSEAYLVRNDGTTEHLLYSYEGDGLQFEIRHVHDCLRQGLTESPWMPLDETLAIMRVLDHTAGAVGRALPVGELMLLPLLRACKCERNHRHEQRAQQREHRQPAVHQYGCHALSHCSSVCTFAPRKLTNRLGRAKKTVAPVSAKTTRFSRSDAPRADAPVATAGSRAFRAPRR
jgi:hypothetical protein